MTPHRPSAVGPARDRKGRGAEGASRPGEGGRRTVRARGGRSARGAAAAFTIIEVMISLSIVLALSALALPSMMRWLDRVEPDSVATQIAGAVGSCRGDSVRTGEAMCLVAVHENDRCRLMGLRLTESGDVPAVAESGSEESIGGVADPSFAALEKAIDYVSLPTGIVMRRQNQSTNGASSLAGRADVEEAGELGKLGGALREPAPPPFMIAIVLPDGTIVDPGGPRLTVELRSMGLWGVEINRWTGDARLTPPPEPDFEQPEKDTQEGKDEGATPGGDPESGLGPGTGGDR